MNNTEITTEFSFTDSPITWPKHYVVPNITQDMFITKDDCYFIRSTRNLTKRLCTELILNTLVNSFTVTNTVVKQHELNKFHLSNNVNGELICSTCEVLSYSKTAFGSPTTPFKNDAKFLIVFCYASGNKWVQPGISSKILSIIGETLALENDDGTMFKPRKPFQFPSIDWNGVTEGTEGTEYSYADSVHEVTNAVDDGMKIDNALDLCRSRNTPVMLNGIYALGGILKHFNTSSEDGMSDTRIKMLDDKKAFATLLCLTVMHDKSINLFAINVLKDLSKFPRLRETVMENGVVGMIMHRMQKFDDVDILFMRDCAVITSNLASNISCCKQLKDYGVMEALQKQVNSEYTDSIVRMHCKTAYDVMMTDS